MINLSKTSKSFFTRKQIRQSYSSFNQKHSHLPLGNQIELTLLLFFDSMIQMGFKRKQLDFMTLQTDKVLWIQKMKEVIGLGKLVLILIQKVWIQPQYQQQKQPEQPQPQQLQPQLQLAKNQHQQLRVPTQVGPTQVKYFTSKKIVNIFCHCAFIMNFFARVARQHCYK